MTALSPHVALSEFLIQPETRRVSGVLASFIGILGDVATAVEKNAYLIEERINPPPPPVRDTRSMEEVFAKSSTSEERIAILRREIKARNAKPPVPQLTSGLALAKMQVAADIRSVMTELQKIGWCLPEMYDSTTPEGMPLAANLAHAKFGSIPTFGGSLPADRRSVGQVLQGVDAVCKKAFQLFSENLDPYNEDTIKHYEEQIGNVPQRITYMAQALLQRQGPDKPR